jgi:chromosome partitioning protein
MYDDRTNLAQQVTNDLRAFFGDKVFKTSIPRNVRLAEAPSYGQPALAYDPRSRGAESYIRLAKEILEKQVSIDTTEKLIEAATAAPGAAEQAQNQEVTVPGDAENDRS